MAPLTQLMASLALLPRLATLEWNLAFPLEGLAPAAEDGVVAAGGAGAGGGAAAPAEAMDDAAAPAAAAPDWAWLDGFGSLTDLSLEFNHPQ